MKKNIIILVLCFIVSLYETSNSIKAQQDNPSQPLCELPGGSWMYSCFAGKVVSDLWTLHFETQIKGCKFSASCADGSIQTYTWNGDPTPHLMYCNGKLIPQAEECASTSPKAR